MNSSQKHANRQLQALIQRNRTLAQQVAEQAKQLATLNALVSFSNDKLVQAHAEHLQTEDALRKSESHFRMMTESVVDVVWKLDNDYRFTYISPADEKRRGYTADEVLGHHVFEIFDDAGIAEIQKAAQQRKDAQQKGLPLTEITFEARHRCKNGKWIWGEICYNPEFDAEGNIIGFYGISREITERKHMQDQVRRLAFYDPLTQLPNRNLLIDRLNQAMTTCKRKALYGALLFLDLDNFKPLNDCHGHRAGDLLLIEVAQRLASCVRETDITARFGGDEFVIVLSELASSEAESYQQAQRIAEKIRMALAATYLLTVNYKDKPSAHIEHSCTASIGLTLFFAQDSTIDELLQQADRAMYQAKQNGRNSARCYRNIEQAI